MFKDPTPAAPAERSYGRPDGGIRPVTLTRAVMPHASGSCQVEFGATKLICCATVEEGVPKWRRDAHAGWVSAEYAMLPCSTTTRSRRETSARKGRSMEIERLIGRSLRTVCDMKALGEYTVTVDAKKISRIPLVDQVVALSVGMVGGRLLLDLDYSEDSQAEIDMNLAYTGRHEFIEIQGTGERTPFSRERLNAMLDLAEPGLQELLRIQAECVGWKKLA